MQVKTAPRVLLVTDKPLYQPGQLMHLRALALQAVVEEFMCAFGSAGQGGRGQA